jgi:multiple antibiotic resistance protein
MNLHATPLTLFVSSLASFFAIMNPLANTPIFLSLTASYDAKEKKQAAIQSVLIAFGIVTLFAVMGALLLRVFGITLDAFRIAGGLLIAKVGYDLLHGGTSRAHAPSAQARTDAAESDFGVVVSPLAMPLLAGPGTIVTAMTYTVHASPAVHIIVIVAFAVVCLITTICFLGSETLVRHVSPSFLNVTGRLMGLILAVIGVQMVISGVKAVASMP